MGAQAGANASKEHGIPFYVAAPWSTVDMKTKHGDDIPIEERSSREVTHIHGKAIAPDGVTVAHPAFDVTPHKYITAIITERGVAKAPFDKSLSELAVKALAAV